MAAARIRTSWNVRAGRETEAQREAHLAWLMANPCDKEESEHSGLLNPQRWALLVFTLQRVEN
jgi:hypothetical protein